MTTDVISIEEVLNSRCSSNSVAKPRKSHWGTLTDANPSENIVARTIRCCSIPRLSGGRLLHWFKNGYLFLGFEKQGNPRAERVLHIESGMQHEAVYLACAAQGVGTCIHNQTIEGTRYGEKIATAKHLIKKMLDPFETGRFTTRAPGPQKPFKAGRNLIPPSRDGDVECLPELEHLTSYKKSGSSATEKSLSQLLWAAKGRTPHLIRTHVWNLMWGLTIPTWGGGQDYTSVYLTRDNKLYRYVNWTKRFSSINRMLREKLKWTRGNPTHDIHFVRNTDISAQLDGTDMAIVLSRNEQTNRALWEVGYMLEDMLLQAKSLDVSYETKLFNSEERSQLADVGITEAVAAILL